MPAIGITGSVAAGKSTFTRLLAERLLARSFDTDQAARDLLTSDPAVHREMAATFGDGVFDPAVGAVNRAALRALVFASETHRRTLESILHPRIRARWTDWLQEGLQTQQNAVFLVEIPLLYETDAAALFDQVVVVGCGTATQWRRLTLERGLSPELAQQVIASQWPLAQKIRLCHRLIWNDAATLSSLQRQASLCARSYQEIFPPTGP